MKNTPSLSITPHTQFRFSVIHFKQGNNMQTVKQSELGFLRPITN